MVQGQDLSYEELVHHIVSNKPVPNVVQIPDITLSESLRTASVLQPRSKPWESEKIEGASPSMEEQPIEEPEIDLGNSSTEMETLSKSQSLESLSRYYAMEAEFDVLCKSTINDGKV